MRPHRIEQCFRSVIPARRQIGDGLLPDLQQLRSRRSHRHLTYRLLRIFLRLADLLQFGRVLLIPDEIERGYYRGIIGSSVDVVDSRCGDGGGVSVVTDADVPALRQLLKQAGGEVLELFPREVEIKLRPGP